MGCRGGGDAEVEGMQRWRGCRDRVDGCRGGRGADVEWMDVEVEGV